MFKVALSKLTILFLSLKVEKQSNNLEMYWNAGTKIVSTNVQEPPTTIEEDRVSEVIEEMDISLGG